MFIVSAISMVAHGVTANRRCDFLVRWLNLCIVIARIKYTD